VEKQIHIKEKIGRANSDRRSKIEQDEIQFQAVASILGAGGRVREEKSLFSHSLILFPVASCPSISQQLLDGSESLQQYSRPPRRQ
jgi:hypothetical protein